MKIVQNSFLGIQNPTPLLRCEVLKPRKKQLFDQSYGTLTSLLACDHEEKDLPIDSKAEIKDLLNQFNKCSKENGKSDFELEIDLMTKRAKINRIKSKMHRTHLERKLRGLPSTIKPEYYSDEEDG